MGVSVDSAIKAQRNTSPVWRFCAFARKLNYNKEGLQGSVTFGQGFSSHTSQITNMANNHGFEVF